MDSTDAGRPGTDGAPPADRFTAPRASFGPWLRGQREARNVALAEIAEVSKISLRYLEALEQDRFDVLPAPVFVRGFLREYARVVGLDPDEVVNLYLVSMPRAAIERRFEPAAPTTIGRSAVSRRGLLVAVGVSTALLAAAAVGYWLTRRSTPPTQPPRPQAAARQPQAKGVASPAPADSVAPEAAVARPVSGEGAAPALPPLPATARPAAGAGESAPAAAPLQLLLEFQQDCWVEVKLDGGRRASELRAGGETMTLQAADSIELTLGNATVVRAELNGRPLALPAGETKLLRDFRIDRSLLPGAAPSPPAGQP